MFYLFKNIIALTITKNYLDEEFTLLLVYLGRDELIPLLLRVCNNCIDMSLRCEIKVDRLSL